MSSIITSNIDETYPVAGQDNNSQGFRDNFNNIKIAIGQAKTELEALQGTGDIGSGAAKREEDNNFNGNTITNAVVTNFWGEYKNIGSSGAQPVYVDLEEAEFQRIEFTVSATNSLNFKNWPNVPAHGKVRVAITGDTNNSYTVTFATEGGGVIKKSVGFPNPFTISTGGETKIIEAWSNDNGATVYLNYIAEFSA